MRGRYPGARATISAGWTHCALSVREAECAQTSVPRTVERDVLRAQSCALHRSLCRSHADARAQVARHWLETASKIKAVSESLQRQESACFTRGGLFGGVIDVDECDGDLPFLNTFWCHKKADLTVPLDSPNRHRRALPSRELHYRILPHPHPTEARAQVR